MIDIKKDDNNTNQNWNQFVEWYNVYEKRKYKIYKPELDSLNGMLRKKVDDKILPNNFVTHCC